MRFFTNKPWRVRYCILFIGVLVLLGGSPQKGYSQQMQMDTTPGWQLHGAVSARAVLYTADGLPNNRRSPVSYVLSGTVTPSNGDFSIPVNFLFTEQDRNFSQPMNMFSVSPTYKWLTVHGGFLNLNYSPYTLAGHQFLGGALELNPGYFRLSVSGGRFLRAVEEDLSATYLRIPAYERTGMAAKIGYGSPKNFLELSVLKAKDDENSLKTPPQFADVLPGENLVIGTSTRITLFDDVFSIFADAAVSNYTRDVRAREIPLESLEIPSGLDILSKIIKPRLSTQVYSALNTGMSLTFKDWGLRGGFTRVDPDYKSMGAYFINNDIQLVNGALFFNLFNQTTRLNLSVSQQRDNLQDKKLATTNRLTPSLTLSVNPSASFGVDVQYSDMITTQQAGKLPLVDSLAMDYQNPLFLIAPRFMIMGTSLSHLISVRGSYQQLVDNNRSTKAYTEYQTYNAGADYTLMFLNDAFSVTVGASQTNLNLANQQDITNTSFTLGASKTFFQGFNVNANVSYSTQEVYSIINGFVQTSYRLGKHSFGASVNLISNSSSQTAGVSNPRFTEITGILSYAILF